MLDIRFRKVLRPVVLAASVVMMATACGGAPSDPASDDTTDEGDAADTDQVDEDDPGGVADDLPHIVVTTSILGDIVEQLVREDAEVTVLMPPGVDPHGYEPSARDAATLRDADLVLANGLRLEESLASALDGAQADGVEIVELAAHLDPIAYDWDGPDHEHDDEHDDEGDDGGHGHEDGEGDAGHSHGDEGDDGGHGHDDGEGDAGDEQGHDDEDGHDHGHDHGPEDPHVWLDPVRMADGVELIATEIAALDTAVDEDEWTARADEYRDELLAVHEDIEARFGAIPEENRTLVTNHDALGYLADRYGFEVLGTVIPGSSTQVEADPSRFAELVQTVEEAEVPAIFAENIDSTVLAEQLASEVIGRSDLEVEVVAIYTDALGEPGSGADTYLGLLRTNAQLIADALT